MQIKSAEYGFTQLISLLILCYKGWLSGEGMREAAIGE